MNNLRNREGEKSGNSSPLSFFCVIFEGCVDAEGDPRDSNILEERAGGDDGAVLVWGEIYYLYGERVGGLD